MNRSRSFRVDRGISVAMIVLTAILAPLSPADAAFVLLPEEADLDELDPDLRAAFEVASAGRYEDAASAFRTFADAGSPEAMFGLGMLYHDGLGVDKSTATAAEWYERAADRGHVASMFNLATLLLEVDFGRLDEGRRWLRLAAEGGSARAQTVLGQSLLTGAHGFAPDPEAAESILSRAAEAGEAEAAYAHARYLATRENPDWERAEARLKEAAEAGHAAAMIDLADAALRPREGAPDPVAARGWFQRAADAGAGTGWLGLGRMAEAGIGSKGGEPDFAAAFDCFTRAAEAGDPLAWAKVGQYREHGLGTEKSIDKAFDAYMRGARAGVPACMFQVGLFHDQGAGRATAEESTGEDGSADDGTTAEEAIRWYYGAAIRGLPEAQNRLGAAYRDGHGVMPDTVAAAAWFERAARAGDPGAQTNLAMLFEAGSGVPQSFENAASLYTPAAEAGHAVAQFRLARLLEAGRGVEKDRAMAFALLTRAAESLPAAAEARDALEDILTATEKDKASELLNRRSSE